MTDKTDKTIKLNLGNLAQFRAAAEALADLYKALQHEEVSEPDPLNENDHRGRMTGDGYLLTRNGPKHWHWHSGNPVPCPVVHEVGEYSLEWWDEARGPLTFAADTSPVPQDAAKGKSDAVDAGPSGALLCPGCGHDIDEHRGMDCSTTLCTEGGDCVCRMYPSDIARHLIAKAGR